MRLGAVSPSRLDPQALVTGQTPAEGTLVKQGTAVSVFVATPPPAPPKSTYDLSVQTLGIDVIGTNVVVTIVVQNLTDAMSPATTVVARAAKLPAVTRPVPPLPAHGQHRLEIPLPITPRARGTTVVIVVTVDPRHSIDDVNRANNSDRTAPAFIPR